MVKSLEIGWNQIEPIVESALAEDLSGGDVTTEALIPENQKGKAYLIAKSEGVLAGIGVASLVFQRVDSALQVKELVADGSKVQHGDKLAFINGKVASI
ncbi:MAG: nicotinate-nucleotide diphosphorylase (carboxylating), partial [Dehalococcoidia bacterium]